MGWKEKRDIRYQNVVQPLIDAAPDELKNSVLSALRWAKDRLMRLEGEGHCFYLSRDKTGVVCSFAKPEWPGDHCSYPQPTGALAVLSAVFEYENGF